MTGYSEQTWVDGIDGGTPITAARLGHLESGIDSSVQDDELDADVSTLLNTVGSQTQVAAAANVVEAVQNASLVQPSGNWNFGIAPTVAGAAIQADPSDGSVTDAKVATGAAINADKLADGTTNKVMTAAERTKLAGLATVATTGAYADLSGRYVDQNALDAVGNAMVAGENTSITYDGTNITIDASGAGLTSVGWGDLPAGSIGRIVKSASTGWPARSTITIRTDIGIVFQGTDPGPTDAIDFDEHHVTTSDAP